MGTIIRAPSQNIFLEPGDLITVQGQPFSFIAMGAEGRQQEVQFEAPTITLAQALARSGGLSDSMANIRGVFVFRFESDSALDWPTKPVARNADGKVPVVYWLDLAKPRNFFVAKTFPVCDGDLIYTANAPGAQLQKVFSFVGALTAPGLSAAATAVNASTP
jgi:polysaccharide export outer membrane protein